LITGTGRNANIRNTRKINNLDDILISDYPTYDHSRIIKKDGTKYFREIYIPKHNARFAVLPKDQANVHRVLLPSDDLSRIFTLQSERKISKALTVQYKNTRYQLLVNGGYRYTLINAKILIEEGKIENVTLRYKNKGIPYETIQSEILKVKPYQVVSAKEFQERRVNIPRIDHPWRTRFLPAV